MTPVRIISATQLSAGYNVICPDGSILNAPYRVLAKLDDGTYEVEEPQPDDEAER